MKLLLDSHVFLWMRMQPEALSATARATITDPDHERILSVASVWELGIKEAKKRLGLPEPLESFVLTRIEENRISLLPVQLHHALESARLPPHHADPFDRMLIAQARTEGFTLVTADPWFANYDVPLLAAAR